MKFSAAFLATITASFAGVFAASEPEGHEFQAPGPDDARGPCPGLNSLANHGWLPRSGQNITAELILQAAIDAYNINPDVLILAAKMGHLTTTDWSYFTLNDIKLHGNIEHDASLSRNDWASGNNWSFNETVYTTMAQSNPGFDFYNTTSTGGVQKLRVEQSNAWYPGNITNTDKEFGIRSQEAALALGLMGDPVTGIAPKEYVDIFFREDRLPYKEGWVRNDVEMTSETISGLRHAIQAASDWAPNNATECEAINFIFDTRGTEITF